MKNFPAVSFLSLFTDSQICLCRWDGSRPCSRTQTRMILKQCPLSSGSLPSRWLCAAHSLPLPVPTLIFPFPYCMPPCTSILLHHCCLLFFPIKTIMRSFFFSADCVSSFCILCSFLCFLVFLSTSTHALSVLPSSQLPDPWWVHWLTSQGFAPWEAIQAQHHLSHMCQTWPL